MTEEYPYVIIGDRTIIMKGLAVGKTDSAMQRLQVAAALAGMQFHSLGIAVGEMMREIEVALERKTFVPLSAADFDVKTEYPLDRLYGEREYVPRLGDDRHRGGAAARRRWKKTRATGRR